MKQIAFVRCAAEAGCSRLKVPHQDFDAVAQSTRPHGGCHADDNLAEDTRGV